MNPFMGMLKDEHFTLMDMGTDTFTAVSKEQQLLYFNYYMWIQYKNLKNNTSIKTLDEAVLNLEQFPLHYKESNVFLMEFSSLFIYCTYLI